MATTLGNDLSASFQEDGSDRRLLAPAPNGKGCVLRRASQAPALGLAARSRQGQPNAPALSTQGEMGKRPRAGQALAPTQKVGSWKNWDRDL